LELGHGDVSHAHQDEAPKEEEAHLDHQLALVVAGGTTVVGAGVVACPLPSKDRSVATLTEEVADGAGVGATFNPPEDTEAPWLLFALDVACALALLAFVALDIQLVIVVISPVA
jgi:hypothetical protein